MDRAKSGTMPMLTSHDDKRMILLNVGPVIVPERVRNALLKPDMCHREPEFSELLSNVRRKLAQAFRCSNKYSTILLSGSGTAAVEATISSVVRDGKFLVLSNGYYGEKMAKIARLHGINTDVMDFGWGRKIIASDVDKKLKSDATIRFVGIVHTETSTAMLNHVSEIGELAEKHDKILITDAMASIGVEDLDVKRDRIDFCIGSANKCIEGLPGCSFVSADKSRMEELKDLPPRTSYLDLYQHYRYEEGLGERAGTPFTPPVQIIYALDEALNLLLEETIEKRRERYANLAGTIRDGLEELGFGLFIPREVMCNAITSVLTRRGLPYQTLHDKLKEEGFIIYAGMGAMESKFFRIGNMGALTLDEINRFLDSMKSIVKKLPPA
ncbi:MAG: aminotransferase class V-fold PLP-dependent enzyme [Candidatus Bathyarchaeia archaeon]